jgi:predicted thioesterase
MIDEELSPDSVRRIVIRCLSCFSRIGAAITATATITSVDGRKVEFDVAASDENGEIGRGTHSRFIVDAERFMTKARA